MRRGLPAALLWPLSLLFRSVVSLRRFLYAAGWLNAERVAVPVIVAGNVFIGGTGKTPLTIWLVQELRRAGYTPGVISRGYGVDCDAPLAVTENSLPSDAGDEPVLIARRTQCPVVIGRGRVAAARALLAAYPAVDVIVSDDGLQHYALERDIEIILFDGRGVGNGWMLPAGPLREPASRRADFVVVNAEQTPPGLADGAARMHLVGEFAERLSDPAQRIALTSVAQQARSQEGGGKIVAAAGIGNPARFFGLLRAAGINFEEMPLPDHHDFADNPFIATSADVILMTEKDAVKCRQIASFRNDPRLWVVPVTAHIGGTLAEQIVEKLRGHPIA
jgi:tetraacyldisaccharide 4'-kinase